VGQDVADESFVSIVVQRGYQSSLVAADVEDGKIADLVSMREHFPQLGEICESVLPHQAIPMRKRRF
jgi:hypothetical protein